MHLTWSAYGSRWCSQRGIPGWPYGGQGRFWIGWRNMKKDPCEYQTHRDPRQSRALSYLSQAGLCTRLWRVHSYRVFKRVFEYSDEATFSLTSSCEDEVIRATHVNIWKPLRVSESGAERLPSLPHQRTVCLIEVGEGAHIGESHYREEHLMAMSSQSYSRD